MFVGTDNTAFMLAQAAILLHKHPQWLHEMHREQVQLVLEFGPEIGRKVRWHRLHASVTCVCDMRLSTASYAAYSAHPSLPVQSLPV
jgi:cytochrome P450